jgi:hypothetical protein
MQLKFLFLCDSVYCMVNDSRHRSNLCMLSSALKRLKF